jgi:hypothetical protein
MALSKITTESILAGEITSSLLATGVGGKVVQVVNVLDTTTATGTTVMNHDDTIPQQTEGDEYMTLAITPTNASNKLLIEVVAWIASNGATRNNVMALFQDSTAGALASAAHQNPAGDAGIPILLTHYMTSGTTSETTFKIRAGGNTGTFTWTGQGGTRRHGGILASTMTITEISA